MKNDSKDLKAVFTVDAVLVRSPITYLMHAIRDNQLILGVVMAASFLERFGVEKLEEYFQIKNVPLKPLEIDRFHLDKIRKLLFGFRIITEDISEKWGGIGNFRNELVHKIKNPDLIDRKKAQTIVEEAIECLRYLGAQ